jgi:hypothetical protein
MASSETVLAGKELLSSWQWPVEGPVMNLQNEFDDRGIFKRCLHQEIQRAINRMEDHYTVSSGDDSNLKSGSVECTSTKSDSTIPGSETINKDIIVKNSEGNLQSNIDDFGIKSEHYDMLTNNELVLPFENSINDSDVKSGHLLKPLKNENNEYCMPYDNSFCLPIINNSKEFETVHSTEPAKQENLTVLSTNCEEVCAEDLIRRTPGSEHEGSFPLSAECTQYDEINERKRKRKHRNKKRKGRSTEEDIERLQAEYVFHTAWFCVLIIFTF